MTQQHAPSPAEAPEQAAPVKVRSAGEDEVCDVGAVVPLSLHDEGLGPDHLLRRAEADRHAKHGTGHRVREPEVIHDGHAIPRAVDEVDEPVPDIRLGEPVRERELGREPGVAESGARRLTVFAAQEHVQVLRVPDNARIRGERIGPADQELHATVPKRLQRPPVYLLRLGVERGDHSARGRLTGRSRSATVRSEARRLHGESSLHGRVAQLARDSSAGREVSPSMTSRS